MAFVALSCANAAAVFILEELLGARPPCKIIGCPSTTSHATRIMGIDVEAVFVYVAQVNKNSSITIKAYHNVIMFLTLDL